MALLSTAPLAPAAKANHEAGWEDGGAAVPASVDLGDVASHPASGVVVAVGADSAAGTAKIFRRAGGDWIADSAALPAGATDARLVAVALSADAAWAVGTYVDASAVTQSLVLRAPGGAAALAGADPITWSPPGAGALAAGVLPSSVAIRGTAGMIGTAGGTVHPFDDASNGSIGTAVSPPAAQAAGEIEAIAIHADGEAFTGGRPGPAGSDRIYAVDLAAPPGAEMLPVVSAEDPEADIVGIGAVSEDEALAVEGPDPGGASAPGTWAPTSAVWMRDTDPAFTTASAPSDLSLTGSGGSMAQAVSGAQAGDGAAWRRTGTGSWTRDAVSPDPLNGVAVAGTTDIWAVGDGGAVLHYEPLPDPPPPETTIDSGPPASTPDPSAIFTFSSDQPEAGFECSLDGASFAGCDSPKSVGPLALGGHSFQVRARNDLGVDLTPATRSFTVVAPQTTIDSGPVGTIDDTTPTFSFSSNLGSAGFQCSVDGGAFAGCTSPRTLGPLKEGQHSLRVRALSSAGADPTPASRSFTVDLPEAPCTPVPRPLLRGVRVRKRTGRLLIEFRLAARARVSARAYRGDELVGRVKARLLRRGEHELALRYRGGAAPDRLRLVARPAAKNACK